MYTVYILKNKKNQYYIGSTSNLTQRIIKHNNNGSHYTKGKGLWILVYSERYNLKEEAWKREHQIKRYKGGKAFKELINKSCGEVA